MLRLERERIVATSTSSTTRIEAANANYLGGDIITGANRPIGRDSPRLALDPYSTGIRGVFICSAATPPAGRPRHERLSNAARSALRHMGA